MTYPDICYRCLPEDLKIYPEIKYIPKRDSWRLRGEIPTLVEYGDREIKEWLGFGTPYWDNDTYLKVKANLPIKIYRAVPKEIDTVHPGAYVTQSKKYAQMHLESILRGEGHIIEKTAKADELIAINPNEFWYAPESYDHLVTETGASKMPQVEVGIPPVTLGMEEFRWHWEPHGWRLLVIGPTATWRQEWGEWEAIRDLAQNSLDETEAFEMGVDGQGLWIADKGKGVAVADFLLGPPKLKPPYARGRFGEGMKIAALALLRKGYRVRILTAGKEIWMVFWRVKVDGEVDQLAALWRPDGAAIGTRFHILGYFGPDFRDRFVQNIPRENILHEGPSPIDKPISRNNQLIFHPKGRVYARDIYLRDINSPWSYNLWGFEMAPDRHGPKSEREMHADMGRLWATCDKIELAAQFLGLMGEPVTGLETYEGENIILDSWGMGIEPRSGINYADVLASKAEIWQGAWDEIYGKDVVLWTSDEYNHMVEHIGYKSKRLVRRVGAQLQRAIRTDEKLVGESQKKLGEYVIVPDKDLTPQELKHLEVARAIASKKSTTFTQDIQAALIPPASEEVSRTDGLYVGDKYLVLINRALLRRLETTIDVFIHEQAHYVSNAGDLSENHSKALSLVGALVASMVARGMLDDYLKEVVVW